MIDIFGIYHSASRAVKKAKLFMNGRSQAVRLPREFRMPGTEVYVERRGEEVVLRPAGAADRWARFAAAVGSRPDFPADRDRTPADPRKPLR
jgi:antitoxin VapB